MVRKERRKGGKERKGKRNEGEDRRGRENSSTRGGEVRGHTGLNALTNGVCFDSAMRFISVDKIEFAPVYCV